MVFLYSNILQQWWIRSWYTKHIRWSTFWSVKSCVVEVFLGYALQLEQITPVSHYSSMSARIDCNTTTSPDHVMGRQAGWQHLFFVGRERANICLTNIVQIWSLQKTNQNSESHRINNSSQSDSQLQDEGGLQQRTGPAAAAASATFNVPFMLHLFGTSFHWVVLVVWRILFFLVAAYVVLLLFIFKL